jgi:hypothetical protein
LEVSAFDPFPELWPGDVDAPCLELLADLRAGHRRWEGDVNAAGGFHPVHDGFVWAVEDVVCLGHQ